MLNDLRLLQALEREPVLNLIDGYPRDEDSGPVATDVFSFHVDRTPVEADTWLCTYHGAPSEGLRNDPIDATGGQRRNPRGVAWDLWRGG